MFLIPLSYLHMKLLLSLILLLLCGRAVSLDAGHADGDKMVNNGNLRGEFMVGLGKTDITGPVAGVGFMGYASPFQLGSGIINRLHARIFLIAESSTSKENKYPLLLVHCDLWGIPLRLRQRIATRLEKKHPLTFRADHLMIHAQHTHSGPGGYEPTFVYHLSNIGFNQNYFELMEERIFDALSDLLKKYEEKSEEIFEANLFVSKVHVPQTGRNRSPEAFMNNPKKEIEEYIKINKGEKKNSFQTILRIFDVRKQVNAGVMSFFPIHTTNLQNFNALVSSDNKGFAQYLLEKKFGRGFLAGFFQTEAGDVSPNMANVTGDHTRFTGVGRDYIESCEIMGAKQADPVIKHLILNNRNIPGKNEKKLEGKTNGRLKYVDFHAPGKGCKGAAGLSFFAGTEDGRAFPFIIEGWTDSKARESNNNLITSYVAQYVAGALDLGTVLGPGNPHEFIALINSTDKLKLRGSWWNYFANQVFRFPVHFDQDQVECHLPKIIGSDTLFPHILPMQILYIGDFIVPAVPFEVTSIAGDRIKKMTHGNELLSCSNGYASYMTTREEYMMQHYEGGFTVFGPNQLEVTIDTLQTIMSNDVDEKKTEREMFFGAVDLNNRVEVSNENFKDNFGHHMFEELSVVARNTYFGKPLRESYDVDKKIQVDFVCVHPMHSQKYISSFCSVEKLNSHTGIFEPYLTDDDWNVRFMYRNHILDLKTVFYYGQLDQDMCTCEWNPNNDKILAQKNGINELSILDDFKFRLVFNGAYRNKETMNVEYFEGHGTSFAVISSKDNLGSIYTLEGYLVTLTDKHLLIITIFVYLLFHMLYKYCIKPYLVGTKKHKPS